VKSSLVELTVDNLLENPSGILLIEAGGWLDERSGGVIAEAPDAVQEVNTSSIRDRLYCKQF
jgi:hypothetical protein